MSDNVKYRPNAAGIVVNAEGKILVGERSDVPGAWQFPQGGIQENETARQALRRELEEEIGLSPDDYEISQEKGPYRYRFPAGRKKAGYDGQEQTYFLVRLRPGKTPSLEKAPAGEFSKLQWIAPDAFQLDWLPPMKRTVYRAVLRDFFGLKQN